MKIQFVFYALSMCALCNVATAQAPASAPSELDRPPLTEAAGGLPGSPTYAPLDVLRASEAAGGLTQLSPETALAIIDAYRSALGQRVGSEAIVEDLDLVRTQLSSGSPDARIVGDALVRLGERTQVASNDDADAEYALLAKALIDAGKQLQSQAETPARN